jgi:hypothetical protein
MPGLRRTLLLIAVLTLTSFIPAADASAQTSPPNAGNRFLGINLAGIADWTTEWPFVDAFRISRAWISNRDGAAWGQGGALSLTPEGWVASLAPGQRAITPIYISGYHPTGDWVLLYDGDGDITFPMFTNTIISQSPGRIVLNVPRADEPIWVEIRRTNPANPVRNMRLIMPGFEATYAAQPFHPLFLERLSRFGALRFMDFMSTNNSTIRRWNDRPQVSDATYAVKGVPAELMVQLANTLRADPWFTMPHLADDDYVRRFAMLVRDQLDPSLKIYIEYSNETWNCQFTQCAYMGQQSAALGWGSNAYWDGARYHARRATEIFAIWEQVFGGHERFVRVLASQAVNAALSERIVSWEDAWRTADALAIAPYFSTDLRSDITVDQIISGCRSVIQNDIRRWISEQKAVADRYGLDLLMYEGGQHLLAPEPWNDTAQMRAMTETAIAANRDPRMADLYLEYMRQWDALGGGMLMHFSSVGLPSRWGMWGALEYQDQPLTQAPKYRALMAYITEKQSATTATLTIAPALQGRASADGQPFALTLTSPNSVAARSGNADGDGLIVIAGLRPAVYTLRIKHPQYLALVTTVELAVGGSRVSVGPLRAGDVNNDNVVSLLDFSLLAASFNLANGAASYDARADLNSDGIVSLADFSLLASSFNQTGAP